ncbi:MAG: transglutaminase-like domain-containing protein [Bacteroidia bacterium]|nr:transglutaminase-like domain-containing protein [Bacteroidia bacterium]
MIQLLDDSSVEVRERVEADLLSLGMRLPGMLALHWEELDAPSQIIVKDALPSLRMAWFEHEWLGFLDQDHEGLALESAMTALSYLRGGLAKPPLGPMLDDLAMGFSASGLACTEQNLVSWILKEKGFGPPIQDYYSWKNSDLVEVILRREGLQISLAVLIILIGNRVGLSFFGLNVPRHFLLATNVGDRGLAFDVFHRGAEIPASELNRQIQAVHSDLNWLSYKATPTLIVARVLRNLIRATQEEKESDWSQRLERYLSLLPLSG